MTDDMKCGLPGPEGPCAAIDPCCCVTHAVHYGPDEDEREG